MQESQLSLPDLIDGEDKSSPFKNCIRKSYRHLRKWAKRTETDCFRLYERELHHYPVAIDLYAGRFCVHYFAPSKLNEEPPQELVNEINESLEKLFNVSPHLIYWRTRIRTKETRQYEKLDEAKEFFTAIEYGVKFRINLTDYLDTGLFLDHRETRQIVANSAKGKRLLNLFAYTCSFSVHAAKKGAVFTKSVDLSNTYTEWGRKNFQLNELPSKNHPIIRSDCLKFIKEERANEVKYDIVVIDPPTISRSKKMSDLFEIQKDYVFLIKHSLELLNKDGIIFFSTNSRRFEFDMTLFPKCSIVEISNKTRPIDFKDPKIHRCWKITQLSE